jgi:hypothetical protein
LLKIALFLAIFKIIKAIMTPPKPSLLQERQENSTTATARRQTPPYIQIILLWAFSFIVGATATVVALKIGSIKTLVAISLAIALPLGWISFVAGIRKIIAVMLLPKMVAAFGSIIIMASVLAGIAAIISLNLALFGIEPWVYTLLGAASLFGVIAQTLTQPTLRGILIFAARSLTGAIAGTLAVASLGITNIDRISIGATSGTLVAAIASLLLDSTFKKFTNSNYSKVQATRNIVFAVSCGLLAGASAICLALNLFSN